MNNVDQIIKYLSGEMNPAEAGSFEKELASRQELKKEFDQISTAYKLIKKELQQRDEDEFKKRLRKVMEQPARGRNPLGRPGKRGWYYLFPLAASLAIVLSIFFSQKSADKLFLSYYHPENDRVVNAYSQGTRGRTESGILQYQLGNYMESREIMSSLLDQDSDNMLVQLYFLLSSIETGFQEEALEKLAGLELSMDQQIAQAIYWYAALAHLKSDQTEKARSYLHPLIQQQGPYQSDAKRLEKTLLK